MEGKSMELEFELGHEGEACDMTPDVLTVELDADTIAALAQGLVLLEALGEGGAELSVPLRCAHELWVGKKEQEWTVDGGGTFNPSSVWLNIDDKMLEVEILEAHSGDRMMGTLMLSDENEAMRAIKAARAQARENLAKKLGAAVARG